MSIKNILSICINCLKNPGKMRFCPICNKFSSHFKSYGIVSREDALCPHCGSLERHRLFWLYLSRKTKLLAINSKKNAIRILHIAPEKSLEKRFRKIFKTNYLTADLFDTKADIKMDINDIRYPDHSFDFIYCSHVLEHIIDDRGAMRELFRVLSPEGLAILLVPITSKKTIEDPNVTDPEERLRLFGQKDHVRRYGPDYLDRLIEAGFKVQTITPEEFLTKYQIKKMGLKNTGKIYACRKI